MSLNLKINSIAALQSGGGIFTKKILKQICYENNTCLKFIQSIILKCYLRILQIMPILVEFNVKEYCNFPIFFKYFQKQIIVPNVEHTTLIICKNFFLNLKNSKKLDFQSYKIKKFLVQQLCSHRVQSTVQCVISAPRCRVFFNFTRISFKYLHSAKEFHDPNKYSK